jgi:hypothetical protein
MLRSSLYSALPSLVALTLAGCIGDIGDGEEPGDSSATPSATVVREPLHRLNRLEYNNTVRDLLGTSLTPADSFPPDSATDGFDNMADGLILTPSQFDLYHSAARDLASAALDDSPRYSARVGARSHAESTGQEGTPFDWGWSLPRYGSKALGFGTFETAEDEAVTISILAGGSAVGVATPEMGLVIDGVLVQSWVVTAAPSTPAVHTFATALAAGPHTITVTFPNGYDQPAENVYNTLVVGYVDVTSTLLVTPPGRGLVYVCDPSSAQDAEACYHDIVTTFAARAWRRPLTLGESAEVTALWESLRVEEGDEAAVRLVIRAMLESPRFLYRASFEAPGADGEVSPVMLDDFTLASRLSYFLWSSMPDAELFDAAASGALASDEGLRAEVQRMLADPKSSALREGFASQWLGTRTVSSVAPDPNVYPYFDEPLRAAMIGEAELFFDDYLHNGRPIGDMLEPDFGFLNDRLAQHYRLPLPGSDDLVRVPLGPDSRRGLVMQGAWLTATSASTRTSPVNRGRWVLEQLLCDTVPPPPPDVPPFQPSEAGATMRETLAEHRKNPACAGCHDLLDPAGLGMEELDGIGSLRTTENGLPVDTTGAIPEAGPYAGARELASLLRDDPRFPACVAEKLYVYASGRRQVAEDKHWIEEIAADLEVQGKSLDVLLELIVLSPGFRTQSPEGAE